MNILHYTIGLPPERNGGSVIYAFSLMQEQAKENNVFALVCGDTLFRSGKTSIKPIGMEGNVQVLKLISPTTPTLVYGVKNPKSIFKRKVIDDNKIDRFIKDNRIEIFHIHTFMGFPIEVLKRIKDLGVKVIYTSHDYYGICLGYSMILPNGNICHNPNALQCAYCNLNAPSEKFLRLANSAFYHFIKAHYNLRGKVKIHASGSIITDNEIISNNVIKGYQELLDYYRRMFSLVDVFHFNSTQTKNIFEKYIDINKGVVANVITSSILDRRKKKILNSENIQFGYIASIARYKGFPSLKRVLIRLYEEGIKNWTLNVWGSELFFVDEDCPNIKYCGRYSYSNLENIMCHLDGTIVPSKWHETFSLVTLESISFGVPAIVSDHVGAKDIVKDIDSKLIFKSDEELYTILREFLINPERLNAYNSKILDMPWKYTMKNHVKEIDQIYTT